MDLTEIILILSLMILIISLIIFSKYKMHKINEESRIKKHIASNYWSSEEIQKRINEIKNKKEG